MTRVLIFTASYGSGHVAAAAALAAAFREAGADATVVDHFRELVHPAFARVSHALYPWILRRVPALWGLGYSLGDRLASESPLTFGMTHVGRERLARLLRRLAPDVVVTVHATPSAVMSSLREMGERVPAHTTVVTDFVAHSQWMARHIDRYCVAAEEVKHEYMARGIAPQRIAVTGVPVASSFERALDPLEARHQLGLAADTPVVLAMAGSNAALGRLPEATRALLAAPRPVQGLVVCGRDAALQARLRHLTNGTGIRTLGYPCDVHLLMAAADVLVTKAGGMTLAEAAAAELPLILFGSLPGQERQNERFAARAGIAFAARSRRELALVLERALSSPKLVERMRRRMRSLRRPDASRHIVDLVLERASTR
jgi:processive 1,2-diacylglycerol beta-glucosyltransferase